MSPTARAKRKNSRNKGAVGERQARDYLRTLGFIAERGQQFSGSPDSPDVRCPSLPHVHIEVKRCQGMGLGTVLLDAAMQQAMEDAGATRHPVVLWRPNNRAWRLTWIDNGVQVTTCGDERIKTVLLRLEIKDSGDE